MTRWGVHIHFLFSKILTIIGIFFLFLLQCPGLRVFEFFDVHQPCRPPLRRVFSWVKKSLIAVLIAGLLGGCGGFSEKDTFSSGSGGGSSTQVFLSGTVSFPSSATASLQKIDSRVVTRRSVSKALSQAGVDNASIALYRATDLSFEQNLIKPGEVITTNPSGEFVVTISQISSEHFSTTENAWVLRAQFQDFELGSLISVTDANSPLTQPVAINPSSDGVVRFLNEEVARKSGGTTREAELLSLPWKGSFQSLALDFAKRRSEVQSEFEVKNFDADNYKTSTALETRVAGREWSQKIDELALDQPTWDQILTHREDLKLGAVSNLDESGLSTLEKAAQARRRKLQLLFTSLEFGFFVSSSQNSVWVKDRWQELEASLAPAFGTTLTSSTLKILEPGLTDEDLALSPIPPGLIEFTATELSGFRTQGIAAEERTELMLQDLERSPWVSWAALDSLATLTSSNLKQFISFDKVLDAAAKTWILRRHSIERVQRSLSSGGLIFYGEDVPVIEQFGGAHPKDSAWESFYKSLSLSSDLNTDLLGFLSHQSIFLPLLQPAYRSAYAKLTDAGFTLKSPNAGYPDPLSETASRNLVFRVVGGQRKYDSKRMERYIELLEKAFRPLHGLSDAGTLNLTKDRPLAEIFPFIATLPYIGFELDSSLGLFQSKGPVASLSVPNVENLGFSRFPPQETEVFWSEILRSSNSGTSLVTDTALAAMIASLQALQGTTIAHLSVDKSSEGFVVAKGKLFLASQQGVAVPAPGFLIDVIPASSALSAPATYSAQSDSNGAYSFASSPIPGDQLYNFRVLVKDSVGSTSPTTALTFLFYLAGFEGEVQLPDFYMESQFALRATSYGGSLGEIQPANLGPVISLEALPPVTSSIVPLRVLISDPESNPVGLNFSFTSGLTSSVTTDGPRISISSQFTGATTFGSGGQLLSFPATPSGTLSVIYWHSLLEEGLESQDNQDNIQVSLQVFEAENPIIRGNQVQPIFFDLDNLAPRLSFDAPLKDRQDSQALDSAEQLGELITVTGQAIDRSQIVSIQAQNLSLSSGANQTFTAEDIGNSFGSWRIRDIPVEQGVENILSFTTIDEFGNQNSKAVTASFLSQDNLAPEIQITSLRFDSDRNIPSLISLDSQSPVSVTTTASPGSVVLSVSSTSLALSLDTVTTNRVIVEGRARDISGISNLKLGSISFTPSTTDSIHYSWNRAIPLVEGTKTLSFSALDQKGNESGASKLQLSITTVDFSAPAIALLTPSSSRGPQTVATRFQVLSGTATDFSRITSFQLCSALECKDVTSSDGFWNWSVSLNLSEARTNVITGQISDEFEFQDIFTESSPFVSLELNDITSPSFILTSVLGGLVLSPPLIVNENFSETLPRVNPAPNSLAVNQCPSVTSSCTITLLGQIEDHSGFSFSADNTGNFSDFILRVSHRGSGPRVFDPSESGEVSVDLFGPVDGTDFSNETNTSRITTSSAFANSSGVQTTVPFQVEFNLKDDGLWPVELRLRDGSQDLFNFNAYLKPELFRRELIYLKKDQGSPIISELSLGGQNPASSAKITVSGRVDDELSPITSVTVNGVSTSIFSILPVSSAWNSFVSLETGVSVGFQVQITLAAGSSQVISITAQDNFGNLGAITTSITVLPLFTREIRGNSQFQEPIALGFGGPNLEQILVADAARVRIESMATNGVVLTTVTGNQKAGFFDILDRLQSFDSFVDRLNQPPEPEALVVDGVFQNGTQTGNHEVLRLEESNDQYQTSETSLSPSDDHVFRDQIASTKSTLVATQSLVRFTPLLGSVIYLYQATDTAGNNQIFRYVKAVINEPSFQSNNASDGGLPAQTGIAGTGANPFEVSSQVASIVITQSHILDSNGAEGVTTSFETLHLLDTEFQRITRFRFNNQFPASGGGFVSLPSISLTSIALATGVVNLLPTAMDLEPDGKTAYVANETDLKIYKLDITSSPALLMTSFGGSGLSDGKFQSLDFIRGLQPLNENNFSTLYLVDRTSARVSRFKTDGSFIDYLGVNPLDKGGMVDPKILINGASQWALLDEALQSLDFFDETEDSASSRLGPEALGLSSFTSSIDLLIAPESGFLDLTNFDDSNYETQSSELFKTTTQEYFYLEGPNVLHHSVLSSSNLFTATGTGTGRLRVETTIVNPVQHTAHTQARSPFNNLVDMTLVEAGATLRVYILEQDPDGDGQDRVQEVHFSNQAPPTILGILPATKNLSQTSSVGICEISSGILVLGELPTNSVDYAPFPAGNQLFIHDWSFESRSIFGFLGNSTSLNQPGSMDCSNDRLVIADGNTVKIFSAPPNLLPGLTLVQEIQAADPSLASTDPLRALSGPLEVLLRGSDLYVLERNRDRVLRYQVK